MSGRNRSIPQQVLNRSRKLQEPQCICYRRSINAEFCRDIFVTKLELILKRLVSFCNFKGIQVLSKEVFREGNLKRIAVAHTAYYRGNCRDSGEPRSSPAALSSD